MIKSITSKRIVSEAEAALVDAGLYWKGIVKLLHAYDLRKGASLLVSLVKYPLKVDLGSTVCHFTDFLQIIFTAATLSSFLARLTFKISKLFLSRPFKEIAALFPFNCCRSAFSCRRVEISILLS